MHGAANGIDDRNLRQQPCIGSGPMVPGEVVRMVCSNEACPYNQYVPLGTFQQFEEYVLTALKKAPRARGWSAEQCRQNLWTKKGYELVYRACGCNCSKGFVRRDMQYLDPMVLLGDGTPPQPKSKLTQMAPVPQRKMSADMQLPQPKPGGSVPAPLGTHNGNVSGGSNGTVPMLDDDSSDEEGTCPLCMEEMDTTDQTFLPCPCGYQMCLYCFNHVKENLNGQCPACRSPYDTNNYRFKPEPTRKKNKEKKDPAVKEAEMAAQAQAVARQQAQARADMIARAQAAQRAQGAQFSGGANAADMQARAQEHRARIISSQGQEGGNAGSWAAITGASEPAPVAPTPGFQSNSQAWPSLGGNSSRGVSRVPSHDSGWGASGAAGESGDVDDWESLAGDGEASGVPGLDDAKKDAEVSALMRQVAELQRKLAEAQEQVVVERQAREAAAMKANTLGEQQAAFQQEFLTLAGKFQPQNGVADTVAPGLPSWGSAESLPPPGVPEVSPDLWNRSGFSSYGGLPTPAAPLPQTQELPGLTSIFGGGLGGGGGFGGSAALGASDAGGVWGSSTTQSNSNPSPWSFGGSSNSSMGGGASSIW